MRRRYILRLVSLDARDYLAVRLLAHEMGLGYPGFSKALRIIIREWLLLRRRAGAPPGARGRRQLTGGNGASGLAKPPEGPAP